MIAYNDIIVNKNITRLAKNIRNTQINILELLPFLYLLASLGDFLTNFGETELFSKALNRLFFFGVGVFGARSNANSMFVCKYVYISKIINRPSLIIVFH